MLWLWTQNNRHACNGRKSLAVPWGFHAYTKTMARNKSVVSWFVTGKVKNSKNHLFNILKSKTHVILCVFRTGFFYQPCPSSSYFWTKNCPWKSKKIIPTKPAHHTIIGFWTVYHDFLNPFHALFFLVHFCSGLKIISNYIIFTSFSNHFFLEKNHPTAPTHIFLANHVSNLVIVCKANFMNLFFIWNPQYCLWSKNSHYFPGTAQKTLGKSLSRHKIFSILS